MNRWASLLVLLAAAGTALGKTVWQSDFGGQKPREVRPGAAYVADGDRSVLQLAYDAQQRKQPVASAAGVPGCGRMLMRLAVRGENLRDIACDLRFSLWLERQDTKDRYYADGIVCGVRIGPDGYRELPIPIQVAAEPASYTMSLIAHWPEHRDRVPVVSVRDISLEMADDARPYISYVWKSKTVYRPRSDVRLRVHVVNPSAQEQRCRLEVLAHWGIAGVRKVAAPTITLAAGTAGAIEFGWRADKILAGHYAEVRLLDADGNPIDVFEKDYGVETDARNLEFGTKDLDAGWRPGHGGYLYVAPASHTQSLNAIEPVRQTRTARREFFSWSWCDLAGFVPPMDPYLGNNGQWWLSLKEYKDQIALMNDTGVHTVSYILGHALSPAGYELFHEHPDWFVYNRDGEVGSYDMSIRAHNRRQNEFGFVQVHNHSSWLTLDPTNPDVRRLIADKIVESGKVMGFKGGRWDVWSMEVKPGFFRLDGTPIAETAAEADRLTAESLAALKKLVARELPEWTWGYNYASPEENVDTPLTCAEKCRGRGWMLDEVSIGYASKTSPFHTWDAYAKRMVEWGDRVREMDGIYNPWPFHRGYSADITNIDWLQMSIYHLLSGGRVYTGGYAKIDGAGVGDMSLLAWRFSNVYAGWDRQLQPENQTRLVVDSPDTVWWRRFVFTNKSAEGVPQDIVHLVNSPPILEAEANLDSEVRDPVGPLTVRCVVGRGKAPTRAWLLTAESLRPGDEPAVRAVPLSLTRQGDAVAATVPSLLYFKTVVFEYPEGR